MPVLGPTLFIQPGDGFKEIKCSSTLSLGHDVPHPRLQTQPESQSRTVAIDCSADKRSSPEALPTELPQSGS